MSLGESSEVGVDQSVPEEKFCNDEVLDNDEASAQGNPETVKNIFREIPDKSETEDFLEELESLQKDKQPSSKKPAKKPAKNF